jgi:hypothetical protein
LIFFLVMVALFFVVAIPVLVITLVCLLIVVSGRLMSLARRLLLGSDQNTDWQVTIRRSSLTKDAEPPRTHDLLWDWWIDGSR